MLEQTKTRIEDCSKILPSVKDKLKLVQHDITQSWPLKKESADFIFGNLVLEHVKDLSSFFHQVSLHLKPKGTLFLCEFHPFKQYEVISRRPIIRSVQSCNCSVSLISKVFEFIKVTQRQSATIFLNLPKSKLLLLQDLFIFWNEQGLSWIYFGSSFSFQIPWHLIACGQFHVRTLLILVL